MYHCLAKHVLVQSFGKEQADVACMRTLYDAEEPKTFEEAQECDHWKEAMQHGILWIYQRVKILLVLSGYSK